MPNNTIDSLQIEISASAEKANKAIDILQKQLDKICGAMENVTKGAGYSNLNKLTQSLNALSSVNIPNELSNNLTNVAKATGNYEDSNSNKKTVEDYSSENIENATTEIVANSEMNVT